MVLPLFLDRMGKIVALKGLICKIRPSEKLRRPDYFETLPIYPFQIILRQYVRMLAAALIFPVLQNAAGDTSAAWLPQQLPTVWPGQ